MLSYLLMHSQFKQFAASDESYLLAVTASQIRRVGAPVNAPNGAREKVFNNENGYWETLNILLNHPAVSITESVIKSVLHSPSCKQVKVGLVHYLFQSQARKNASTEGQKFRKINAQKLCYESSKLGHLPLFKLFMESSEVMDTSIDPECLRPLRLTIDILQPTRTRL